MQRILLGLGAVLLVALGAGLVLGPLARGMAPAAGAAAAKPFAARSPLKVAQVKGSVYAQTPQIQRSTVEIGTLVQRPAVISIESTRGRLVLSEPGLNLLAEHEARFMMNGPPAANALFLEGGFVLISSRVPMQVHVPRHAVKVTGTVFTVWAGDDSVRTAVIDDSIELQVGDEAAKKYARGRDIIIEDGTSSPALLPSRLQLSIQEVTRRPTGGYSVRGRTTPRATVLYRGERSVQRIRVRASGAFSATIPDPDPRSLAAYDGSGRWAILDVPSPTIEDFMQVVFGSEVHSTSP